MTPEFPVTLVWEAAILSPGTPLFPSVRHLVISSPHHEDYITTYPSARECRLDSSFRRELANPPAGVVIFDTIDVCTSGRDAFSLLNVLPTQRMVSITTHEIDVDSIVSYFPRRSGPWERFTIFQSCRNDRIASWVSSDVRLLEAFGRTLARGRFHVVVYGAKWRTLSLRSLALDQPSHRYHPQAWYPSPTNEVQVYWSNPEDPSCPSCVVCGE